MSEFVLPLAAEGAVTAPTGSFNWTVPTAETTTYLDVGAVNYLEIPELGWILADGVNPLRIVTRGSVYDCGGQAPETEPTLASGTKASTRFNSDEGGAYVIANGDVMSLVVNDGTAKCVIIFGTNASSFTSVPAYASEVSINGSTANAIVNLKKFINQTGVEGTDYYTSPQSLIPSSVTAGTITSTDLTITAKANGVAGNAYACVWSGGAGPVFEQESTTTNQTAFSGGTDASGSAPGPGTFRYFYTSYRAADQAETGPSPIASISNTTASNVSLSALTANADTTFDYTRIYRTTTQGVEFRLLGAVPRATMTFTDDVTDTILARSPAYNTLLFRSYAEGMPPRGLALAYWKGAVWTLGAQLHAEYVRGTVSVTEDSDEVTFSVKGVTANMRGRVFKVAATSEEYTLLSVNESTRVGVLDRNYTGTTNGTASYTIRDAYDACRLRRSVPFLYNQWPVDESPGRVETDDPKGGTALLATTSRLFAFSKTSVVAVTGEGPESWEISKVAEGLGCVAAKMVVGVEGGGIFLSPDGFYAIGPDASLTCISSPKAPLGQQARGIDDTVARVNWACVDQGYSVYDREDRLVIFGVPLDDALVPNYEIVFDLQNSTWALYKRAEWTAAGTITLPSGAQAILAGDREGWLWHVGIGESDGFYGAEAVATLTGAQTVRVLTATGTPFTTSEGGKPVIVLYADGSTVAYGKVASSTTSALTLTEDLAAAPAASDQAVLGGIAWQAKSGHTTFGEEYRKKTLRSVTIRHAKTTRGEHYFSFAVDGGSLIVAPVGTSIGTHSQGAGKTRHMTQYPGDSHQINLRGFKPGGRAIIRGGVFDVLVRENG